jgi:hypothetical protein
VKHSLADKELVNETATSVPTSIGAFGQWTFTHGSLNICHGGIACTARCHVSSPLPRTQQSLDRRILLRE